MLKKIIFVQLALLGLILFSPTEIRAEDKKLVSDEVLNVMQQNRVVVTCKDDKDRSRGGQGTVMNSDKTGTWILTADHLAANSTMCNCLFKNEANYIAHTSWESSKYDLAILFISRMEWPTHAAIVEAKLNEDSYVFGELTERVRLDYFGFRSGFEFYFNDKLYKGSLKHTISEKQLIDWKYPGKKGNMLYSDLFHAPGSSGGAVFDSKGNVIGLVSGGERDNHLASFIVDVLKSLDDKEDK